MKLLFKILITAILVMLISHFMTGVHVKDLGTSLLVAIVLGLLNIFIKPIFVLLTLPFTIFTLGLFLLVINAIIILLCTNIVGGFHVDSFFYRFDIQYYIIGFAVYILRHFRKRQIERGFELKDK